MLLVEVGIVFFLVEDVRFIHLLDGFLGPQSLKVVDFQLRVCREKPPGGVDS